LPHLVLIPIHAKVLVVRPFRVVHEATPCSNLRYYTGLKPSTTFLNTLLIYMAIIAYERLSFN